MLVVRSLCEPLADRQTPARTLTQSSITILPPDPHPKRALTLTGLWAIKEEVESLILLFLVSLDTSKVLTSTYGNVDFRKASANFDLNPLTYI